MHEDALKLFNRSMAANKYFFDRGVTEEVFNQFELGTMEGSIQYSPLSFSPVFPIRDINGNLMTIGSRRGLSHMKYYYLPPFEKSKTLYGINHALPNILEKDFVYVVEGVFDELLMFSKGYTNTVALLGSSFSTFQLYLLTSLTKNIAYVPDMDSPGLKAFDKNKKMMYTLCSDINIDINFTYPSKDVADFLLAGGKLNG